MRVADVAVVKDSVAAQDAVQVGPEPKDGFLAAGVAAVYVELDAFHAAGFEGFGQQQEFGFGVGSGAAVGLVVEGPADAEV